MLNTMNEDQVELSSQLSSDKRRRTPSSFHCPRGKHTLMDSGSLYVFPAGNSHCLNGRGGKHSTEINPEELLLVRLYSKLLHIFFPRLVNKFAVVSWRFIDK